jgi:hypothetical protein
MFGQLPGLGAIGGAGLGGALGLVGGAGIGGGLGGFMGGVGGSGVGQTRWVTDKRARAFIVRGPERDVRLLTDLVAVMDKAPGKPLPKVKNLHVFKLKYADPETVVGAVTQLAIKAKVAPVRGSDDVHQDELFVVATGTDEQIREVRAVVEALDVKSKEPADGEGAPSP